MAISKKALTVGLRLKSLILETLPLSPIEITGLSETGFRFETDDGRKGEFFTHDGYLHGYAVESHPTPNPGDRHVGWEARGSDAGAVGCWRS